MTSILSLKCLAIRWVVVAICGGSCFTFVERWLCNSAEINLRRRGCVSPISDLLLVGYDGWWDGCMHTVFVKVSTGNNKQK